MAKPSETRALKAVFRCPLLPSSYCIRLCFLKKIWIGFPFIPSTLIPSSLATRTTITPGRWLFRSQLSSWEWHSCQKPVRPNAVFKYPLLPRPVQSTLVTALPSPYQCVSDHVVRASFCRPPFVLDTSPECTDREDLGRRRSGTRE